MFDTTTQEVRASATLKFEKFPKTIEALRDVDDGYVRFVKGHQYHPIGLFYKTNDNSIFDNSGMRYVVVDENGVLTHVYAHLFKVSVERDVTPKEVTK